MTKESILALLNRDAYQVELGPGGRGITELVKQEIEALDLPGIDFIKVVKETIHMEILLPILLVMQKNDNDEIEGEMGIEGKYNSSLKGTNGKITYQKMLTVIELQTRQHMKKG